MDALLRPTGATATGSGANADSGAVSGNSGAHGATATGRAHAVPPADADIAGQVFDVRSGSAERAPDGSLYADW